MLAADSHHEFYFVRLIIACWSPLPHCDARNFPPLFLTISPSPESVLLGFLGGGINISPVFSQGQTGAPIGFIKRVCRGACGEMASPLCGCCFFTDGFVLFPPPLKFPVWVCGGYFFGLFFLKKKSLAFGKLTLCDCFITYGFYMVTFMRKKNNKRLKPTNPFGLCQFVHLPRGC